MTSTSFVQFRWRQPGWRGDVFRCLNHESQLPTAAGWNDRQHDALWLYHLHYFDDLCAQGATSLRDSHRRLVRRWITENKVGQGVGWEPYPVSRRIVNWIKWALGGEDLGHAELDSLAMQSRWLVARVERHLLANHLFANAVALIHAGMFFQGTESDDWLAQGTAILVEELAEQVLNDGAHYERSPMYHAIILGDILDLLNLDRAFPSQLPESLLHKLRAKAQLMLQWAQMVTHPDGGYAFFNDTTLGIAPSASDLAWFAAQLDLDPARGEERPNRRIGCQVPGQSGYLRLEREPMVVIFDAASIGPDYQPGHAHADTLSFEMSWGTHRVICNSGISTYKDCAKRHWERSTAAHNTVEVDSLDSSEVWSSFRVGRRAYPGTCVIDEASASVTCDHDGYAHLWGSPVHRRTVTLSKDRLDWTDDICGSGTHRVVGRIPLHPLVTTRRLSPTQWELALPSGQRLVITAIGSQLEEELGDFAPEFGRTERRKVIVWSALRRLPISVSVTLSAR